MRYLDMIFRMLILAFVIVIGSFSSLYAAPAQSTYSPAMGDYCVQPPFLTNYVPPQVLFVMGKDHKFYYPAYNDASDINGDGKLETGYLHSFDYYGYFDSYKCYSYDSKKRFIPVGHTSDKYCSTTNCTDSNGNSISCAGAWSGNFLNWVAMSRADIVKMVIYGGFRTADDMGTNYAEISGEWIPQDGHIWGKEYLGSDASKLFPIAVNNKRALFCVNGTTTSGGFSISQLKVIPDVTAVSGVTVSGGLRAWHWINVDGNSDICGDSKIDLNGDGNAESATLTGRANYNITAKVCDPADGFLSDATWEAKHCKAYGANSVYNYRPVGLMQLYGETLKEAQVCSKDMYTACNNDVDCSKIGKGECLNAGNMFFGLIAGSYKNPKSGGYVRKDIYSMNEETNQENGLLQVSATSGKGLLIKSIEQFKAQSSYPLNTQWGNPIAEILYEGMRYWAGKGTPTSDFVSNISSGANGDNGNYASKPDWDKPASLYPSCSMRFNLVFSDVYNSFDDDQLPGSAFNSFTGDLSGLNVKTLSDTIWKNENFGTSAIVGESGTTSGDNTDGTCGGKTIDGFGDIRGLCPAEGGLKGTYYAGAVALYGHNSIDADSKTPNVLTYVVAFTSNVPEMRVTTNSGKQVLVMPYGKSVSSSYGWSCSTSNTNFSVANVTTAAGSTVANLKISPKDSTSNCPTMATVGYYVLDTEYDASNNLKYVKFNTSYDDLGGTDYDLDVLAEYTVCASGATNANCSGAGLTGDQVWVQVKRVYSSAGNPNGFGFTISGVGDDSKTYMIVQHTSSPPSGSSWAGNKLTTDSQSMKFNATATTAVLPKPPLWYAAKYGGFRDTDGDGLPYTDSTCDPATRGSATRNSRCDEWNKNNDGTPDNYFLVTNPSQMEQSLRAALDAILARVSSGTAASILNNSEGSGNSLLQAVFYPAKEFDNGTSAAWIGEMHNMWYYIDPNLQSTSIREDTVSDSTLNLTQDRIAQFYFDSLQNKTQVRLFADTNGDGSPDAATPDATVDPDKVNSLWKAGRKLWGRNPATDPRKFYTHTDIAALDNATTKMTTFNTANVATLTGNSSFLSLLQASDASKAAKIINYTLGIDQVADADGTKYRNRKVTINNCGINSSYVEATASSSCNRVWKLGDIVSSTPKLISTIHLNQYSDESPLGYGDTTYKKFIQTANYKSRGMVFVGGNDGMLHAFRLGVLEELSTNSGNPLKARFDYGSDKPATTSDDLGREEWSFIPKQSLPYLTYLKEPNYCHLYYVDKSSYLVDASLLKPAGCAAAVNYWDCTKTVDGSTWRTVLIGGTGFGGAAKWNGDTSYTAPTDSVKTPVKGTSAATGVGYSSYFALDVTDPSSPSYMWEFPGSTSAVEQMGFATTGPAIVRVAAKIKDAGGNDTLRPDHSKNGRWFAVFANGPTGPIDSVKRQFLGQSDQQLRIFIVDLATGALVRTIDKFYDNSSLPASAFAGSLATSWVDTDRATPANDGWYSDDAIYVGYTQLDASAGTWTKGGVVRLSTKESANPFDWVASSLISGIGPVTTSVSKLQDRKNKNFWIYFGTGRYFYQGDDISQQQVLYGIKEPCYSTINRSTRFASLLDVPGGRDNDIDPACTTASPSGLVNQSGSASVAPQLTLNAKDPGWYIALDGSDDTFSAERMITDPIASPSGAVFFTTFKPSGDLCKFGGDSLIWAVRYDTGGVPPARAMKGKALIQVSTGAFSEISLETAFSNPDDKRYDQRRLSSSISGVPPTAQGLSLVSFPPPSKKYLHIREK